MGKFIWKGRILRVALEELKNDYAGGGLEVTLPGDNEQISIILTMPSST